MLARITATRSIVSPLLSRAMSSGVRGEGSVAQSKGFGKKEKAVEDQYAKTHEAEQLQKLRKEIDRKKAELAALEKEEKAVKSE